MNSKERVLKAIKFKPTDFIPVNTKKDAMAPAVVGYKLDRDYLTSPEKMVKAELALMEIVDDDFCVFTGLLGEGMGMDVEWKENDYPQKGKSVIHTMEDIEKLPVPDPWNNEFITPVLEGVKLLKKQIGDEKMIEVWVSGVFNIATKLAGIEKYMQALVVDKEFVHKLNQKVVDSMIAYAKALKEAGCDVFFSPDACSSPACISPKLFTEMALPYHIQWVKGAKEAGLITCYHPCGGEYPIIDQMAPINADIFWFSDLVDIRVSQQIFYKRFAVGGDVNGPDLLCYGTPKIIDEYLKERISGLKHKSGVIIHPGCGLSPNIPLENLKAMVDATRKYSELAGSNN